MSTATNVLPGFTITPNGIFADKYLQQQKNVQKKKPQNKNKNQQKKKKSGNGGGGNRNLEKQIEQLTTLVHTILQPDVQKPKEIKLHRKEGEPRPRFTVDPESDTDIRYKMSADSVTLLASEAARRLRNGGGNVTVDASGKVTIHMQFRIDDHPMRASADSLSTLFESSA